MAVRTGLEPATSCVTGRHSNQLNYRTIFYFHRVYLHLRPPQNVAYFSRCFCSSDPYGIRTRVTAVKGRCLNRLTKGPTKMVSYAGFEPATL